MIVLQSTYNKLIDKYNKLIDKYNELVREKNHLLHLGISLQDKYNSLVYVYNNLVEEKSQSSQFTKQELKDLRSLIHPDKHGNSERATRLTQKVNSLL